MSQLPFLFKLFHSLGDTGFHKLLCVVFIYLFLKKIDTKSINLYCLLQLLSYGNIRWSKLNIQANQVVNDISSFFYCLVSQHIPDSWGESELVCKACK